MLPQKQFSITVQREVNGELITSDSKIVGGPTDPENPIDPGCEVTTATVDIEGNFAISLPADSVLLEKQ